MKAPGRVYRAGNEAGAALELSMTVQYAVPRTGLPAASSLRRWGAAAIRGPVNTTVRFVDAREGRQLNRDYRGRDYATNVLTFCYGETAGALLGDIVLCAPVIAREAAAQRKPLRAHYAHLLVHGLLHLQGHDHECEHDARRMEELETTILADLGFANPYAEEYAPA
jgi:probable rRNA maturation factor